MLTLSDAAKIDRLQEVRKLTPMNARLCARLDAIDGIGEHPFAAVRWVEDMTMGEAEQLRDLLEEYDCGVDTLLDVTCPSCFFDQEHDLPLASSFFQRRSRKKKRQQQLENANSG